MLLHAKHQRLALSAASLHHKSLQALHQEHVDVRNFSTRHQGHRCWGHP